MSQLGRIGGQVLTDNLLRAGVDLAFETDLLYLDVTNNRIGVRDSTPIYDLDVNSNIRTNELTVVSLLAVDNLRFNIPNTITTSVGGIDVYINGGGEIFHDRVITNNLVFDGNQISSISNSNIILDPNGTGTVELRANTDITGDLAVTGNITMSGDLTGLGTLTLGDQTIDTVTVNTDFTQSIIPGDDVTYALGADAGDSSPRRWAELHSPGWQNISTGIWPGSGLVPQTVTVSNQTTIDGNINKISAIQSNEDLILDPDTGILYVEKLKFETEFQLKHVLDNPNAFGTSVGDRFGYSIALDGNYAIVGASHEDDAGGSTSGKAYIFDVTTGSLVHTLNNPNAYSTSAGDTFGYSVAIDGNYAIVGAYGEDDAGGSSSGKAYIFDVTTGSLVHTLDNSNAYSTSAGDNFGNWVAIDGNYVIVGAVQEDDAGGSSSGKAYIYDLSTSVTTVTSVQFEFGRPDSVDGTFTIDLAALGVGSFNTFNIDSIDIRGDLSSPSIEYIDLKLSTAVSYDRYTSTADDAVYRNKTWLGGQPNLAGGTTTFDIDYLIPPGVNISPSGMPSGYRWQVRFNMTVSSTIFPPIVLDNPNAFGTSASDNFGRSVAISGDRCIVGAVSEGDAGGTSSGKAYIFDVSTGALLHTLDNPNAYGTSAGDRFGVSVAIDGNYAIVGAYFEDDAGGTDSGKAYIFNVTTGALIRTLDNPNAYSTSASDFFGYSVAIDGNYAIVSAYGEDDSGGTGSGKAYIFNVTTGSLLHTLDNPNAYSTSASDLFGVSVAISGNYAIVGAYQEDDAGGTTSGKVYVFLLNQIVTNLNPATPVTIATTGIGYYLFADTNAMVIPAGDNSQRRASPEVGETRWNTEEGYLECYDGTVWAVSTGGGIDVTVEIMEDLGHVYTLMLG